jgi:hypothetical protein
MKSRIRSVGFTVIFPAFLSNYPKPVSE